MAYAAVTSLIQTLEYLVKFPCLVFEIKIIQAKGLDKKLDQVLKRLELDSAHEGLEELESVMRDNLIITDHKDDNAQLLLQYKFFEPLRVGSFMGRTSNMKEEKEMILEEINSFQTKLNHFLHLRRDMDNYRLWQLLFHKAVTRQYIASDKLKEDVTFFYEVATETTLLCQELQNLLTFLDNPSNNRLEHIVECIRDVAYGARILVDVCMLDKQIDHAFTDFKNLLYQAETSGEDTCLEIQVKRIFHKQGIRECLLQTLKKVQSVREEIAEINFKALTLEDLQSGSTSLHGLSRGNSNQEDVVVGLDDDICRIIEKLTRPLPFRLEILTIVGMGGIGKTTLARKVFDNYSIVLHFHCRAWVTVSQVYEVKDLLFWLLCSFSQPTYERHDKSKEEIGEELYRKLKGRTYLIVMDDLWSMRAWNAVRQYFPDDRKGSRIILTSRSIITELKPYHFMRLLDRHQSWELLEKVVFGRNSCPHELVDVGKQIVNKCQGLPLAIVVVGGLLSRIRRALDCWQDIVDSVRSLVHDDPTKCLDILALSYRKLPNRLKACWLYLGAFPEDCEIEVQKLVHLWVAEGILDPKPIKDMEQVAEDNLEDLICRNLVLVGKRNFDGKIKTCRLHDFLRELCLREAEKAKFMYVIARGAQGFRTGIRDLQRLSIHSDYIGDYSVPSFPHALSFMCFSLGYGFSPDLLLLELQLKLLRVLDIYFLHFDHFPIQILEMVHLRYIALNVTYELPASMPLLRNLQTILIHGPWGCPILSLEYWSMPSLRHLLTSVVTHLKNPSIVWKDLARPFVPEYLVSLSTISFSSCTREVFSIMPQLKKLGICETEKDYIMGVSSECLANLHLLCKLETLKCSFYRETRKTRDLSRFALPYNLKKLTLSWSYLPWEEMAMFAILGHLTVLKLKNFAFQGPRWELNEVVFRCLKSLLIESTDLVHWEVTSTDHFPALKHLVLRFCNSLNEIPYGVGELPTVSLIELHNCSKSVEDSANEFAEQVEDLTVVTRSDFR